MEVPTCIPLNNASTSPRDIFFFCNMSSPSNPYIRNKLYLHYMVWTLSMCGNTLLDLVVWYAIPSLPCVKNSVGRQRSFKRTQSYVA